MVLPSGLVVPPLPYLAALVVLTAAVAGALYALDPAVTRGTVLALVPWMVAGAGMNVLSQVDALPAGVAPLFGAPVVYVTTFVAAGAVWAGSVATVRGVDAAAGDGGPERSSGAGGSDGGAAGAGSGNGNENGDEAGAAVGNGTEGNAPPATGTTGTEEPDGGEVEVDLRATPAPPPGTVPWVDADAPPIWETRSGSTAGTVARRMSLVGTAAAVLVVLVVLVGGLLGDGITLLWPLVGLVVAGVVTRVLTTLLRRWRRDVVARTGTLGGLVVFAHALDGVSTAVGVDVFGTGERTPLPRLIMEFAGLLPTADLVGVGWLFVAVKLAVAVLVVVALAGYVDEEPRTGYLLLGLVAAVGLGPGVHNLLLFVVAA